jgi:hypothetical protein
VLDELEAAGLVVLADKGYRGSSHAKIPYYGRTSRSPRSRPTAPTPGSAPPASARTPSSRPGGFSVSSAAAPGAPDSSPRPSIYCRSATHKQDGKGSLSNPACRCLPLRSVGGVVGSWGAVTRLARPRVGCRRAGGLWIGPPALRRARGAALCQEMAVTVVDVNLITAVPTTRERTTTSHHGWTTAVMVDTNWITAVPAIRAHIIISAHGMCLSGQRCFPRTVRLSVERGNGGGYHPGTHPPDQGSRKQRPF